MWTVRAFQNIHPWPSCQHWFLIISNSSPAKRRSKHCSRTWYLQSHKKGEYEAVSRQGIHSNDSIRPSRTRGSTTRMKGPRNSRLSIAFLVYTVRKRLRSNKNETGSTKRIAHSNTSTIKVQIPSPPLSFSLKTTKRKQRRDTSKLVKTTVWFFKTSFSQGRVFLSNRPQSSQGTTDRDTVTAL